MLPLSVVFLILIMLAVPGATGIGIAAAGSLVVIERLMGRLGVPNGVRGYFVAVMAVVLLVVSVANLEPSDNSPYIFTAFLAISAGLFAYGLMLADDY